jgi:tRNA (guanine-N7-)-methyltransferase
VKPGRRSVFADRLKEFPALVFSDGAEYSLRGRWREFFRERIGPAFDGRVVFEVGCFDADLLAAVAPKFPGTAFVGLDWKYRAIHTAAGRIEGAGVRNVALLHGRGQEVRRIFADGELDEVWVFHPDPCDGPKELKNRLFSGRFLGDLHAVLRAAGARVVLKTDHPEYFDSALAAAMAAAGAAAGPFEVVASSTDYWKDAAALANAAGRAFAGEQTGFERRFVRRRKPIYYLELTRR